MLFLLLALPAQASLERTVFVRGEQIAIPVSQATSCDIGGLLKQEVPAGGTFAIDTLRLRPGEYTVRLGTSSAKISLVDAPNPWRYPVWKWGGTAPRSFSYWAARGFNGVSSPMVTSVPAPDAKQTKDIKLSLEDAARLGLDYGVYVNPLFDSKWKTDTGNQAEKFDGSKLAKPYPRRPAVVEDAKAVAAGVAATFGAYPAWRHSLLGSEFQLDYDFSDFAVQLGREEASVDVKTAGIIRQPAVNLPKDGLIEDDNPRYRYLRWWFHRGMGDANLNAVMATTLKAVRPDILTWHDPYRLAPTLGSASGLDAISTWTYCQPDMTRLFYTRVLQAAASADRQRVMQTITLFLYPQFVQSTAGATASLENDKPGGNDFYTAGPDFARVATWLTFSQRPDILSYYYGGTLQPDDPSVDRHRASPETFDAIGEVVRDLVEPFGPAILTGKPEKAKVAVLLSAAAVWLGDSPKLPGYPNEQILPYCSLLAMNHVPFDVVFDDDVVAGRLKNYDCLVLPQAGALTRSMHREIVAFAASGKRVIADSSLKASVPGAIIKAYDFTFQRQVDGVELSKGHAVLAHESRARMEGYAADLAPHVAAYRGKATAESPRAIVNTVECGDIRFVFVVNDNRDYGPRFGSAKLHMDQGVPLETRVNLGAGVAYDAMTGQRLPSNSLTVTLPAAGGKLYVVSPKPIGGLSVTPPSSWAAGQRSAINAEVAGANGTLPLRFTLRDAAGGVRLNWCVPAVQGRAKIDYAPAENDPPGAYTIEVENLATRERVTKSFAP